MPCAVGFPVPTFVAKLVAAWGGREISTDTTMNDTFATPAALEPESGFTPSPAPSVKQAADDLRAAAGEKAREFVHVAGDQARALKDRAVETAEHFREVAVGKAQQLKSAATEKAGEWKAVATEKAQHLKDSAAEHWTETRDKARDLHVTTEDYIRQHPTKSVLCALGIGFAIGLIVRR